MDKPTPADIWLWFLFNCLSFLAELAEVDIVIVYNMFTGEPVARWQAKRVLRVIGAITNQQYTLDTVDVALLDDESSPDTSQSV